MIEDSTEGKDGVLESVEIVRIEILGIEEPGLEETGVTLL